MELKNQKGFTFIELILFLALSGLFLLIALTGVRGRTSAVQFTDTIRSFEAELENQRNSILTGVSPLGQTGGVSGDKLILGRYFELNFGTGTINVYLITGDRVSALDEIPSGTMREVIHSANPVIEPGIIESYEVEWGGIIKSAGNSGNCTVGPSLCEIDGFAYIRNPYGEELEPYGLINVSTGTSDIFRDPTSNPANKAENGGSLYPRFSSHICVESSDGRFGEVKLGEGSADTNIDTAFDSNVDPRLQNAPFNCKKL